MIRQAPRPAFLRSKAKTDPAEPPFRAAPGFRQLSKTGAKTGVISASLNAKNSTVFPILVRLWNFFLVLRRLGRLQLKLQAVSDKRYEFRIRGLALGIAHGIPEEALQGVQVSSIPGNFNRVANGPLYPRGRCLEGLGHLGV